MTSAAVPSSRLGSCDPPLLERLERIYGEEKDVQALRYGKALEVFRARFGPGPVSLFRAPGRINLIGGHTDYNHGYVMPVALDRDLLLVGRARNDRTVRLSNIEDDFPNDEFVIDAHASRPDTASWSKYVQGAAHVVAELSPETTRGVDCLAIGAAPHGIPRGSGLSSSTALTVAAVMMFADAASLALQQDAFVQLGSDAEWYVGTRGGIMDQYASLFGRRNHALFLDCRPTEQGTYATKAVPLPEDFEIIVAETGVRHDNVRGGYNRRVAACRSGVGILRERWPNVTHLRDLEAIEWEEIEPLLPEEMQVADAVTAGFDVGDIPGLSEDDLLHVRACCRHVWQENQRVIGAFKALDAGDVVATGRIVSSAHESARDNYGISFPEMETLVTAASGVAGVAGGRITGAGWGGCAVFLVQNEATEALRASLIQSFTERYGRSPTVFPCRSGTAAGKVATVSL